MAISKNTQRILVPAVILLGGFLTGLLMSRLDRPADDPLVPVLFLATVLVFGGGGSVVWWRLLDEAQREAHKAAWLWGGSFGLLAGAVALMFVLRFEPGLLTLANPDGDPADYVMVGVLATVLAQSLGYGLAWLFWWGMRR